MIFANTDKEITIIYSSEDRTGKQILAYAQSERLPIHEVNVHKTKIPSSHWAELANRMGVDVKELVNVESSAYKQKFGADSDFNDHDWLSLLEKNPDVLRAPIVMKGKKVVFMSSPQEMFQFIK